MSIEHLATHKVGQDVTFGISAMQDIKLHTFLHLSRIIFKGRHRVKNGTSATFYDNFVVQVT
eukprot:5165623-Amphidinium_carterae.1